MAEDALRAALRKLDVNASDARAMRWTEENAEAIEDDNRVFSTGLRIAELAGIPRQRLGAVAGAVAGNEDEIRRALERLFTGF